MTEYEACKEVLEDMFRHARCKYNEAVADYREVLGNDDYDESDWKFAREERRRAAVERNVLARIVAQLDDRVACKMRGESYY